MKQLDLLLELIESHLDLGHCQAVDERYRQALACEEVDRPPLVVQAAFGRRWAFPPPWDRFERFPYRQAFDDPAAMMQNQLLERVVPGLILRDDSPLAIRNDHGTIQVASLLGGEWLLHRDNYPWVQPLGSPEAIRSLVEEDRDLDWSGGVLPHSSRTLEFYREQLSRFPQCQQALQVSLPDLQGPMDTAEMLWGSGILLSILTEPELFQALLEKIVRTMRKVVDYYRQFARDRLDPFANTQHGYYIPGRLLIRDDSSILVSPDTYRRMIQPHDARLLRAVGTGSIHFCGDGEHLVEALLEIPDLRGVDCGEPEKMNRQRVYGLCAERRVAVTGWQCSREELVSGQARRDYPTGAVLLYLTEDINEAREVVAAYQSGSPISVG